MTKKSCIFFEGGDENVTLNAFVCVMTYLVYNNIPNTDEVVVGTIDKTTSNSGLKNKSIKNVIIPKFFFDKKITQIGHDAFSHSNIEKIFISKTITTILYGAFYNCSKLKEVTFEKHSKLSKISGQAFSYCSSLESFDIPLHHETFASSNYAHFTNCISLKCVSYFGSLDFSDVYLFNDEREREIRVSSSYSESKLGKRDTIISNKACNLNPWNPYVKGIRDYPVSFKTCSQIKKGFLFTAVLILSN